MKKIFVLFVLLAVMLHAVSHGDLPHEEHISLKTYNLFATPVPLADLIKDKKNIQVSTLTVPEVKTSSLELVPMGKKASVLFSFTKGSLPKTAANSKAHVLRTVFLNRRDVPVSVSLSYEYQDRRIFSSHNITVYPHAAREVTFKRKSSGIPRTLSITFDTGSKTSLILDEASVTVATYDLKKLQRALEENPDKWKISIADNSTDDMEHVLDILTMLNSPEAIKILAGFIRDKRAGLYVFKRLGSLSPLMKKYACEAVLSAPDQHLSPLAATLLKGSPGWNITPLVNRLLSNDSPPSVREAAAMTISNPADYALVDKYLTLLNDPSVFIKLHTVLALKELRPVGAFDILVNLLDHPELSRSALHAIGAVGSIKTIEPLLRTAHRPYLAWTSAHYLKDFNLTDHLPALNNLALSKYAEVREAAAFLFGYTIADKSEVSGGALRMLLNDPSPAVRSQAAFAFSRATSPEFLPYLHKALDDPNAHVVLQTVRAIGQTANYSSLPFLVAHYDQCNSSTGYAFKEEIEKMKGTESPLPSKPTVPFQISAPAAKQEPVQKEVLFRRKWHIPLSSSPAVLPEEILKKDPLTFFQIPGFIEPCTFCIFTPKDILKKRIQATDFSSPQGDVIAQKDITILMEKETPAGRVLEKRSFLFRVKGGESRRIWFFFNLSAGYRPGIYKGSVRVGSSLKTDITIHVLPWKREKTNEYIFALPSGRSLSHFEKSIISRSFPSAYHAINVPYREDGSGEPRLSHLTAKLAAADTRVFLNIGSITSSEFRGTPYSYTHHIIPLHMRRLAKSVLHIQSFCRKNNITFPVYIVNSNIRQKDSEESAVSEALLDRARTITGVNTLQFCTRKELETSSARFSVQTTGALNLKKREQFHNRSRKILLSTDTSSPPEEVRIRFGLYEWLTESDGHVFHYSLENYISGENTVSIPLHLIMAAEGIKDLKLLKKLEILLPKSKAKEKNAERIKNILKMEAILFRLRTGLPPDWNSSVWKKIDAEALRAFLISALILLEQDISI